MLTEAVRNAMWHCVDVCMCVWGHWKMNSTGTSWGKERLWCLHAPETGLISQLIHSALTKLLPVLIALSLLPLLVPLHLQSCPAAAPPIFFVFFRNVIFITQNGVQNVVVIALCRWNVIYYYKNKMWVYAARHLSKQYSEIKSRIVWKEVVMTR